MEGVIETVLVIIGLIPLQDRLPLRHLGNNFARFNKFQQQFKRFDEYFRQWAGQQPPRTPPTFNQGNHGGYGHMSQMSPMGYQVKL